TRVDSADVDRRSFLRVVVGEGVVHERRYARRTTPEESAAAARDVADDEVADDRRLREVDHPDAAARRAGAEAAGHVARDHVRPQDDAAGREQGDAAAVGEPAILRDDVFDQFGGGVAADVDPESGRAAAGIHEVPRDGIAL